MNYLKLKKILAIVCVICQISLLFSFNFAVSADTDYADVTSKLTNFGLFIEDDQMDKTDDVITREELSLILADFCGIDRTKTYPATGVYSDIETSNASAGIMELMGTSGIIASYSDGLYRPSNPATFGVIVKAFINISGYTPIANLKGGWPNGYIDQAEELGITDGIYKQYNDSVTKGEFAQMLYNFLSVELMRTTAVANGNASKFEVLEDRTVASEKLDLYNAEGVLSATDITSLTGEEVVGLGRVVVDGIIYETDKDLSEFLGMYVELYYTMSESDDIGTIVNIEAVENKNDVLVVNDEDILDSTTVTELWYASGKTSDSAEIALDATMIFNGVRKALFDVNDLKPANGSIKLINTDDDKAYDVIVATHYIDYVVSLAFMDETSLVISDKLGKSSVSVDITDKTKVTVLKDGVKDSLASAKEDAVISIAADKMDLTAKTIGADSTKITINISDKVATGKVDGLTGQTPVMVDGVLSHYTYETVTVGGTEYYFSAEYDFANNKPVLGAETTAHLNSKGQVASLTKESEYQYGVIIKAAAAGELGSELKVKMFNTNSKIVVMNCAPSVVIDGKRYKDAEKMVERLVLAGSKFSEETYVEFENSNGTAQLVKYKTDLDKNILEIDTCLRGENELATSLTWGKNIAKNSKGAGGAGVVADGNNVYGFDNATLFFKVPADLDNEEAYSIAGKSDMIKNEKITDDVKIYDLDEFNYFPIAFVSSNTRTEGEVNANELTNIAIVTDLYTGLNKDDAAVTVVKALLLKTGATVELQLDEALMGNEVVYKGSVVRWTGDATDPSAFEVTASVVDGVPSGKVVTNSSNLSTVGHGFKVVFGTVVNCNEEMLLLKVESGTDPVITSYQSTKLSSLKQIYDFDSDSSNDRATVSPTAKTSFKAESDFGANASKVLFFYEYDAPFAAVIYR